MAVSELTLSLGGAWLAAQGHADSRSAALATLELGFGAILPAPSARLFPWGDLVSRCEDLPLSVSAIRVDPPFESVEGSLASSRGDEVLAVRARVERAASLGRRLGVNVLILEAPRVLSREGTAGRALEFETALAEGQEPDPELRELADAHLDQRRDACLERTCRNLHTLLAEFPEFRFCLTESADLGALGRARDLEAILDDLARSARLSYWHRPAPCWWRAASGGTEVGAVLELLARHLEGMDVADYGEHGTRSVPGSGRVDYGLLAPYMRLTSKRLPLALEPSPSCRPAEIRQGRAFLEQFGV